MPFASLAPARPVLRLYADESPAAPAASLTLREIFSNYVLPDLIDPAEKTLQEYRSVLSHWEKLTGNPPVSKLSREVLRDFQTKLLAGKNSRTGKRSAATVNKLFRTLRPLVVRCWPRDSHNPDGLGLCDYFRFPQALKWQKGIPRVLTDSEISSLFSACDSAKWPSKFRSVPASDLWRAAIVLHFNCGPRTFDLLHWDWSSVDWNFDQDGCPVSVFFTAKKTGKPQRLPLNATASAALRRIRHSGEFVWQGWQRTNGTKVRLVWKDLCKSAGVSCVMEDFRKTCNTRHEKNRRGMGPWVLGHSVAGVNAQNYYDPTKDVIEAMSTLPQPQCFLDWVG